MKKIFYSVVLLLVLNINALAADRSQENPSIFYEEDRTTLVLFKLQDSFAGPHDIADQGQAQGVRTGKNRICDKKYKRHTRRKRFKK